MTDTTDTRAAPSDLGSLVWPASRLSEALELLARRAGLPAPRSPAPPAPAPAEGTTAVARNAHARFVVADAERVGLEAEPLTVEHAQCGAVLAGAAPALVKAPGGYLVVVGGSGRARDDAQVRLIDAGLREANVRAGVLRAALARDVEAPHDDAVGRVLDEAHVPQRRRARARAALLALRVERHAVTTAFLLRRRPGDALARQLVEVGAHRRAALHVAAFVAALALDVGAWTLVGRGALDGRLDWGFLFGWGLLLLTAVPVHALGVWTAGLVATDVGALLKRRLLAGALRLEPEEVRHLGAGAHLSRAIEAEEVEAMALGSATMGAAALLEIAAATSLLGAAFGPLGVIVALAHAVVIVVLARRFYGARRDWTKHRLGLTHALVERLVGHRTRLAQEPAAGRHVEEDGQLESYLAASRALDRRELALQIAGGRGFLFVALAASAPAFVQSAPTATLAVGVAAALLGQRAWRRASGAILAASGAAVAWESARDLFRAAARQERGGVADTSGLRSSPDTPVFEARGLSFRHGDRAEPVLRDVGLRVMKGERVLVEGPSGCGKSTLASVVTGLRTPSAGLALLGGVDHKTLGADAWRGRVASAPQFHENHVLTGTLAFNVLLGRQWPPSQADLVDAEEVLRALDLGPLLARMPSGMLQVVGETGWQLSHGEKSRVFLARALLQRADMVVLDETFGALDPTTMAKALKTTFARSETLMVIAHP